MPKYFFSNYLQSVIRIILAFKIKVLYVCNYEYVVYNETIDYVDAGDSIASGYIIK
jgi:hypothetical protein